VTVIEKTDYPFCFEIEFTINPEREVFFPVRLRIPEWASGHKLAARGASVSREPRGFLVVEKKWRAGDKVRLTLNAAIHGREAVNGTVALAYGPLVYSLPIPEKAEIVQSFPQAEAVGLKGFHGYQYDPADLNSAKRQLNIKTKKAPFGFKLVKDKTADSRFPWDRSPLQLQGEMIGTDGKQEKVTLLPMGCTILRRTCF
jgi:uncharacterized protein